MDINLGNTNGLANLQGLDNNPQAAELAQKAVESIQSVSSLLGANGNVTVSNVQGASGTKGDLSVPELDEADEILAAAADLEALLGYLQAETDEETAKAMAKRLDSLKGQLEAAHTSQLKKIDKSVEEAKKQEAAAKAQRAFGWLGAIFAVAVAVIVTITTGGLAAGFAIAGAALAVTSLVMSETGADRKLMKAMAQSLKEDHPDWSKQKCEAWAQGIYGGIELVLGLATAIGGGVSAARAAGKAAETAVKVSASVARGIRLAQNIGNGVMQAASLSTTAATTATGYNAGIAQADATEGEAVLAKLQKVLEESKEELEEILASLNDVFGEILQLLESKTDMLTKVTQEIGMQNA